jgi:hypothetical protein
MESWPQTSGGFSVDATSNSMYPTLKAWQSRCHVFIAFASQNAVGTDESSGFEGGFKIIKATQRKKKTVLSIFHDTLLRPSVGQRMLLCTFWNGKEQFPVQISLKEEKILGYFFIIEKCYRSLKTNLSYERKVRNKTFFNSAVQVFFGFFYGKDVCHLCLADKGKQAQEDNRLPYNIWYMTNPCHFARIVKMGCENW